MGFKFTKEEIEEIRKEAKAEAAKLLKEHIVGILKDRLEPNLATSPEPAPVINIVTGEYDPTKKQKSPLSRKVLALREPVKVLLETGRFNQMQIAAALGCSQTTVSRLKSLIESEEKV